MLDVAEEVSMMVLNKAATIANIDAAAEVAAVVEGADLAEPGRRHRGAHPRD